MASSSVQRGLLAHNRVFEEFQPAEPTFKDRLSKVFDVYRHVKLTDIGFMRWAPGYTREQFIGDLSAAAVIAVVLIPQGMAYSVLTGLDPVYGLYSSTIPLVIYSLITTSSQVAPGPVAPTAILMEGMVMAISGAAVRTPEFTRWHITLAFVTGIFQLILGALRFGWVADLLSWPVMSGFATGAAFIILASQLPDALGIIGVPRETSFFMRMYRLFQALPRTNVASVAISVFCLLVLHYARLVTFRGYKLPKQVPVPFILIALFTLLSYVFNFSSYGVRNIGAIPSDLPSFAAPIREFGDVGRVASSAILLAVINYVQTVSLAVIFGKKVGETVDSTSEMFALGASSVVGSCFQCYTVAGSFTRTVLQHEAGAKTPANIMFAGVLLTIFLVTITRVLYALPIPVLAAIVMISTKQLVGVSDAMDLWRAKKSDFAQLAVTLIAVLVLDIMYGLLVGVGFALAMVLYRCFSPRLAELGRLPGTDVFVARNRFPVCMPVPGVVVLRLDGELHFGNVRVVTDKLYYLLEQARSACVRREEELAQVVDWVGEAGQTRVGEGSSTEAGIVHASPAASSVNTTHGQSSALVRRTSVAATGKARLVYALAMPSIMESSGVRARQRRQAAGDTRPADDSLLEHDSVGVGANPAPQAVHRLESASMAVTSTLDSEVGQTAGGSSDESSPYFAPGSTGSAPRGTNEEALRAVVLDGSRVVDIDATACRELQQVMEAYSRSSVSPRVTLLFTALPGPVRDTLDAFGVQNSTDPACTRFLSIPAAIASIFEREAEAAELWHAITRDIGSFGEAESLSALASVRREADGTDVVLTSSGGRNVLNPIAPPASPSQANVGTVAQGTGAGAKAELSVGGSGEGIERGEEGERGGKEDARRIDSTSIVLTASP